MSHKENVIEVSLKVAGNLIADDKFATDSVDKVTIEKKFIEGVGQGYDLVETNILPYVQGGRKNSSTKFTDLLIWNTSPLLGATIFNGTGRFATLSPKNPKSAQGVAKDLGCNLGAFLTIAAYGLSAPIAWKCLTDSKSGPRINQYMAGFAVVLNEIHADKKPLRPYFGKWLPTLLESRLGKTEWEDPSVTREEQRESRKTEMLAWYRKTAQNFK